MNRLIHLFFAVAITAASLIGMEGSASAHGAYESYKYRVNWPDRWHLIASSEWNLILFDGLTSITMVSAVEDKEPVAALAALEAEWFSLNPGEEVQLVPSTSFADESTSSGVYTYLHRTEDDSLEPYAVHLETRRLDPDFVLWIGVDAPWGLFNSDPQFFDSALQSLDIEPFDDAIGGLQSFVSAPWRVSLATASLVESDPSIGLSPIASNQWLVLVADITNWSNSTATFQLSDNLLVSDNGITQFQASSLQSQIVGRSFGFGSQVVTGLELAPQETIRTSLVYEVPAGASEFVFQHGDQSLPLADLLEIDFNSSQLPPASAPAILEEATVLELSGESNLLVETENGENLEIVLLGTTMPGSSSCHFRQSISTLLPFVGTQVFIESDPSVLGSEFRYLWMIDENGTMTLVNHMLISQGDAQALAMPETATFSLWLGEAEKTAIANQSGLWQECS